MTLIVPAGAPAWVRTADLTTYGGHVEKQNHYGQGVIDALTDVGADEYSQMAAHMAATSRVVSFLTLEYYCVDSPSVAAPLIVSVHSMVGVRTLSYSGDAAPAGYPSASRQGVGDVLFTFPSTFTDPYGVVGAFQLRAPRASLQSFFGGSACVDPGYTATTCRVRAFDAAGAAFSNAHVVLTVHSG